MNKRYSPLSIFCGNQTRARPLLSRLRKKSYHQHMSSNGIAPMNVLITGANRGLGLEFARQYSSAGWRVFACCRSPEQASQLQYLVAHTKGSVSIHALDVADFGQIKQLAAELATLPVDLLINNAGVYPDAHHAGLGQTSDEGWIEGFRVNSIAPLKMTEALVPHLAQSRKKLVINISSKMGSMGDNSSGGSYLYRASKAALNAISKSLSVDLAPQGINVVVLHPGWVVTDMGGPNALISSTQSVSGMRQVIEGLGLQDSGRFIAYDGKSVPW